MDYEKMSVYQKEVDRVFREENCNIVISAVAGSGKTTMLLHLLKFVKGRTLFLAFNKSIVNELVDRVPPNPMIDIRTLHSIGMSGLLSIFKGRRLKVNDNKTVEFCIEKKEEWGGEKMEPKEWWGMVYQIKALYNLYRMKLCQTKRELESVCLQLGVNYDEDLLDKTLQIHSILSEYNRNPGMIDFTDMVYLSATDKRVTFRTPDVTFIDECQDLNEAQHLLLSKIIKNNRFVACGDRKQCQPPGTKVLLSDGSEKVIEDIVVGDKVVGYESSQGMGFTGYYPTEKSYERYSRFAQEILEVKSREYKGDMVEVKLSNSLCSRYTPNHKCYARFNENSLNSYGLYLMERDGYFRIGICKLWNNSESEFSLTTRAVSEDADRQWLLNIYSSRKEAYKEEQYYSYKYGIPQLRWVDNKGGVMEQCDLDSVWERFDKNQLRNSAYSLLKVFNKLYEYPLWSKSTFNYYSKLHLREFQACNLFTGFMDMGYFEPENFKKYVDGNITRNVSYSTIESVEITETECMVYSLNISGYKNYVADSILTHNSIYGFSGADVKSFDRFLERENVKELPLSVCYRCPKLIVEHANEVFNIMEPFELSIDGEVDKTGDYMTAEEGDMVICRNTSPLVKVFFSFLKEGKKSYIKGRDIGDSLISLVNKSNVGTSSELREWLSNELKLIEEKLSMAGVENPTSHPKYTSFQEKVDIIEIFCSKSYTKREVEMNIEKVFKDEERGVVLSTIHKSKGLEADNVYFLDRDLLPSAYAKTDEQIQQERNLDYVARTRAKRKLIYCTSKEK